MDDVPAESQRDAPPADDADRDPKPNPDRDPSPTRSEHGDSSYEDQPEDVDTAARLEQMEKEIHRLRRQAKNRSRNHSHNRVPRDSLMSRSRSPMGWTTSDSRISVDRIQRELEEEHTVRNDRDTTDTRLAQRPDRAKRKRLVKRLKGRKPRLSAVPEDPNPAGEKAQIPKIPAEPMFSFVDPDEDDKHLPVVSMRPIGQELCEPAVKRLPVGPDQAGPLRP